MRIPAQKILQLNIYVSWGILALMCALMLLAEFLKDLLPGAIPALVLLAGLLWAAAGIVFNFGALYYAWRDKKMSLWGVSMAMSSISLYSYYAILSMY